ncbi:nitrate regulatory gene2 protein [Syzygium oleosum]|uniref:nitrate regulatory gene2 protein n=1 Tax=Syzygium oleosum TaxID=219896 RepID=UPI0011D1CFFC|nr:nitrate regulatory gene2 protein [Syzygium oleosum]XP_030443935.1 nitrate regulatory gene2 protein [Syzygium oleosum]
MGCGGSKIDDLHLVTLCRERKELIRAASYHRYALAEAHVSYFHSLASVGEALRKFVDEEVVIGTSNSGSSPGSPVLTLPSEERKRGKPSDRAKISSSSASISHSGSRNSPPEEGDSHLHLSSGSGSDSEGSTTSGHIHIRESPGGEEEVGPDPGASSTNPYGYSYPYPYPQPDQYPYPQPGQYTYPYPAPYGYPPGEGDDWNMRAEQSDSQTRVYYMKKAPTPMKSVVFEEPEKYSVRRENAQWPDSGYGYSKNYPGYGNGGFYGYPSMGPPDSAYGNDREKPEQQQQQQQPPPAPPPSPPGVSPWDYLNVFETYDSGYASYYPKGNYGYGSTTSSPDSKEVREREGIPDLEDETETEMAKGIHKGRKKFGEETNRNRNFGEGTSRVVPPQKREEISREIPSQRVEESMKEIPSPDHKSSGFIPKNKAKTSSSDTIVSQSSPEDYSRKKGVSFEVEETATPDVDSSKQSSLTTLSAHGTRDLQDVVRDIKEEFESASGYGKEVAALLQVGRLPYESKGTLLKAIFSRIMYLVAPSMLSSHSPSKISARVSSRRMKMARAYVGDAAKDFNLDSGTISSTLDKLYAWEKKLYKEVKDEEKLRVAYQEKCKKLKILDDRGAESSKIDATQASIRKLHTKIDVCIRTVDAISSRIHKLRDEELQPQLTELIRGLIGMWRSMLKCHQKQFQAIMESKVRVLKVNTGSRGESSLRATVELEIELLNWCSCFNQWVNAQKSYVESLNGWLLRCIDSKPEETADGVAPFSPSRMGAPAIFVICNDWSQSMERTSQKRVNHAMCDFASRIHELWERQDEEQRQRTRAERISKDFEKQLRTLRMERGKLEHDQDTFSEKTAVSKFPSESGVSHLDDLKVDLDSMRKKLEEERARHKATMNSVNDAASNSLQAGLVPIFETLGHFTSEVLKGYEQVRLSKLV